MLVPVDMAVPTRPLVPSLVPTRPVSRRTVSKQPVEFVRGIGGPGSDDGQFSGFGLKCAVHGDELFVTTYESNRAQVFRHADGMFLRKFAVCERRDMCVADAAVGDSKSGSSDGAATSKCS